MNHPPHDRFGAESVRPANGADAEACLSIYAPVVRNTHSSFETEVPTVGAFTARIDETLREYPWLVCESGGRVLGYAYACRHRARAAYRWSVEVSVFVDPLFHRRGVGRALYDALLEDLRRQGLFNALAVIALPNPASVAFHESLGFAHSGTYHRAGYKMGHWWDVGWWALRLQDDGRPPRDPIPYPRLEPVTD